MPVTGHHLSPELSAHTVITQPRVAERPVMGFSRSALRSPADLLGCQPFHV